MIQILYKILSILLLFVIVACSADIDDPPVSIATDPIDPRTEMTSTPVITNTPTLTSPQTPAPISTGTTVPLAEEDAFLLEMQAKGYSIIQSGSITDARGIVYSAYIFLEPMENRLERLDPIVKETWIIAFYRWDGVENKLLNTFYPAVYDKRYADGGFPVNLFIVNWDDPFRSFGYIDFMVHPDQNMPSTLRVNSFASDINHNDKPEFMVTAFYCPISCSRNRLKTHIFEISSDTQVIDLAADLSGHIDIYPVSFEPLLYMADSEQWYGFISQINIPSIYQWSGDGFVDVTVEYGELIQADILSRIDEIKTFEETSIVSEREQELLIEILQMYQQIKLREEGLQVFLELTDLGNWLNVDQDSLCWLQIARAQAQDEFERDVPFSVPQSTYVSLGTFVEGAQDIIDERDLGNYNLAACVGD